MKKYFGSYFDQIPVFRRRRLEGLLTEFSRVAAETDSPDDVYAAVTSLLSKIIEFDRVAMRFVDPDLGTLTDTFVSGHLVQGRRLDSTRPLRGTVTEAVINSDRPILVADCGDDSILEQFPTLKVSSVLLPSLICVPLTHGGVAVGVLTLRSKRKGAFSKRDLDLLKIATDRFTPILVNSREWAASKQEVHERTVLAEIGRLAGSTVDLSTVWDQIVNAVQGLINFDRFVLAVVEEDGETITDRFVFGIPLENWDENPHRKKILLPAEGVIRSRRARIVAMAENDASHFELLGYSMSERSGLRTAMYAPLMAGERAIGTLSVRSLKEDAFSEHDRTLFEQVASQIGGPVAAAELYSRSLRLSTEMESRIRLELENKKLEEMNQTKARFISMVSHELRTPLTSMIAFTDLIGRNRDKTMSARDLTHLDVVKRNGSRLKLLIEDLLRMSEIESGDISISRTEFSLQESIDQLADSVEPILNVKRQRLVSNFSDPEIRLISDRIRLEQIVSNLVSNASKYSADESEIKVDVSLDSDWVKIAVIDTGEGINESEIPSLFDEFSRLDNEVTRANQGSGLGLAISRQLAAALGGTIDVSSKKGEGSVFTVILPLELPKAA